MKTKKEKEISRRSFIDGAILASALTVVSAVGIPNIIDGIAEAKEEPTLIVGSETFQRHTSRKFYDREFDQKTVERYVEVITHDHGKKVKQETIVDLEREKMDEEFRADIDAEYQAYLDGKVSEGETLYFGQQFQVIEKMEERELLNRRYNEKNFVY